MRPLEYWKGERFLYGRVDNSEYIFLLNARSSISVQTITATGKMCFNMVLSFSFLSI